MRIRSDRLVQVDWDAFTKEVQETKYNLSRIAISIGRSYDYLTKKAQTQRANSA